MSNKKEKEGKNTSPHQSKDTVWDSFWKLEKPVEVNKEEKTVKWF